jgi:hypothetical protein
MGGKQRVDRGVATAQEEPLSVRDRQEIDNQNRTLSLWTARSAQVSGTNSTV